VGAGLDIRLHHEGHENHEGHPNPCWMFVFFATLVSFVVIICQTNGNSVA